MAVYSAVFSFSSAYINISAINKDISDSIINMNLTEDISVDTKNDTKMSIAKVFFTIKGDIVFYAKERMVELSIFIYNCLKHAGLSDKIVSFFLYEIGNFERNYLKRAMNKRERTADQSMKIVAEVTAEHEFMADVTTDDTPDRGMRLLKEFLLCMVASPRPSMRIENKI